MDLALTETQQLLRDGIRDYLRREISFDHIRDVERSGGHDTKLWEALRDLGYLGLVFPEGEGGSDGTLGDLAILVEQLARRAALVPVMETMIAALIIREFGDAARAKELSARIAAGEAIVVPAILERSDSYDDIALAVSGGKLSGEKRYVDYGAQATHHLVAAKDGGATALFLVETAGGGVATEPLTSIGRIPQAIVRYSGAAAERVCGEDGYRKLVRLGRALSAVQCLGSTQEALDMTVEYVSMRVQFGRPIGTFQAVQHHVANMATLVEATRYLVYEAVWALQHGVATDEQLAISKGAVSRMSPEVTMLAQQLHGGIGFIEEYDLHFFTLRAKERSLAWGTAEECLNAVATTVDRPKDWI